MYCLITGSVYQDKKTPDTNNKPDHTTQHEAGKSVHDVSDKKKKKGKKDKM